MLQIEHISKTYRTGELTQHALDDVSLCLRDSEFVAILGPSGSGKTTLLNIIGGLDRYDAGELIINGVSTKQYRDREWDAYRNHSVGFVFQSYNLIPHQSILANVELALTISGRPRAERRQRARAALEQVGLGDQLHKRPAQLSGGQMQRVAIARALVNDPDILLADEPTGALDSETSLQVMELLREVAKDRLVVMVTHNPELAAQYATRTVRLRDGKITDDTDPFVPEAADAPAHRSLGRASMSFGTALSLSFNNLRTKLGRTLLTAFAGSIGIIGIALILSMSNGVQNYIDSVEEDALKGYPLEITDASLNMSAFFAQDDDSPLESEADVVEWQTVSGVFTRMSTNDLGALRSYLESDDCPIYESVQAIEYSYGLVPQIYQITDGRVRQVNPDSSFSALGFSSTENTGSLFSAFSSTDTFRPMPADETLYLEQYDLKAGHWPQSYDECAVVLTRTGRIADITLYVLGLKDPREMEALLQAFAEGKTADIPQSAPEEYAYEDFLGIEFKLLHSADLYTYDSSFHVWTDRSGDDAFVRRQMKNAETLKVVGVVQPKDTGGCLTPGVCYPASLTQHLMEHAAESKIVKAQLARPSVNIFTGKPFGEQAEPDAVSLDALFTVDETQISSLFDFDAEDLALDFSGVDLSGMDLSGMDLSGLSLGGSGAGFSMPSLSQSDIAALFDGVQLSLSKEQMSSLFESLVQGYLRYTASDPSTDFAALPQAFSAYLRSDAAKSILEQAFSDMLAQAGSAMITPAQLGAIVDDVMAAYPSYLAAQGIAPEDAGADELARYLNSDAAQAIVTEHAAALRAQLANIRPSQAQLTALASALYTGYQSYAAANHLPDPSKLPASFADYLSTQEARRLILNAAASAIDTSGLERRAAAMFSDLAGGMQTQIEAMISQAMQQLSNTISSALRQNMNGLAEQLQENLQSAFTVDPEALAKAFSMNMSMAELRDLVTALLSGANASYDGNLRKLGYAQQDRPTDIKIYPTDFEGKRAVKQLLEEYNDRQRAAGNEDGVILYTDMVDTLMRSVTSIVDAVSIVLIAFVAISLIVSSIMIGIITYISVLERTKEIGILRAIGASKRNISEVFNAETFLVGLCAGVMGVGVTLVLLVPINLLLRHYSGVENVAASLPALGAVVLVALSMGLTVLAGLIPSKKAAQKDPVAALRTE